MGRDYYITNLLPRRMNDLDTTALPRGMTHPAHILCPFAGDGFSISSMGLCCSLRGEYLIGELDELGETEACADVMKDMSADESLRFATRLRQCADRIAGQGFEEPEWAPFAEQLAIDDATGRTNPLLRNMIEGPLVTVWKAADWYERVSHLGFGVECVR
jgi:hypothetical protein